MPFRPVIHVLNRKHGCRRGEYVSRPTPLGNPFVIGRDGTRAEVIARYAEWLDRQIASGNPRVINELERLRRIAEDRGELHLICWCVPQPCHAEVVADRIRQAMDDGRTFRP